MSDAMPLPRLDSPKKPCVICRVVAAVVVVGAIAGVGVWLAMRGGGPGSTTTTAAQAATPAAPSGVQFAGSAEAPYEFRYPMDWSITQGEARSDSKSRDTIAISPNGSKVEIALVHDAGPPKALLGQTAQRIANQGFRLAPLGDVRELGAHKGTGHQFAATGPKDTSRLQILIVDIAPGERMVITTWMADADGKTGNRSINMITNSLTMKPK